MGTDIIPTPLPGDDARICARITRRHARTFSLASYFLPPHKRRGTYAVYAFCRLADDIVDSAPAGRAIAKVLDGHREALDAAFHGHGKTPVFRELIWAIQTFGLQPGPLNELLDGVALDLGQQRWTTWEDLRRYCEGVAGCVGEICVPILGLADGADRDSAVARARALGVAMQLTNILRDVGEDAARGRVYVPLDELAAAGFRPDDVISGTVLSSPEPWQHLMKDQMARARCYYAEALEGIPLLAADARRCASACALGYSAILDAIVDARYDTYTQRASVPWGKRAVLFARVLTPGGGTPEPRRVLRDLHTAKP